MVGIKKTIRGPAPRIPFERIAQKVLGNHYELSLVICGDRLAQRMNKAYRKKNYSPNVLSFPLSAREGEIFLNIPAVKRESKRYGNPLRERTALLFVHGCLHLKGLRHGRTMETTEKRVLREFGIT